MNRKRFEQIESSKTDDPIKHSFIDRLKFKRKLELDGVEREKLPDILSLKLKNNQGSSSTTPVANAPLSRPTPVSNGSKIESDKSLVQEIEIAEKIQSTQSPGFNQQKVLQQKVADPKVIQTNRAQEKVQQAKNSLFFAIIIIAVALFLLYQLSKTSLNETSFSNMGFIVFLIVTLITGRKTRWW